jgi:hypothetical protein
MNKGTRGLLVLLAVFAFGAWFVRQRSGGREAEVEPFPGCDPRGA